MPPYLAGRSIERTMFQTLLSQDVILKNPILTGLRGLGKTVLMETFKPIAQQAGWLWVGADFSESSSLTESNLVNRLITDTAVATATFSTLVEPEAGRATEHQLDFAYLLGRCNDAPGLMSDKLKAVLELVHASMPREHRGIVFAYDEAQNLADHAENEQYPLSVLLEVFQSIQRKNIPFMLLLVGLPTLFPKLVASRTYAERMFTMLFLQRLSRQESEEAIRKPVADMPGAPMWSDGSVEMIRRDSGGYPYFIQFICKETFDVFLQQKPGGGALTVPSREIIAKLDRDFFSGRWSNCTDRQRELMTLIAHLPTAAADFSVKDIVSAARATPGIKPFSGSHVGQMLSTLADAGMVYKNARGKYCFAVPMMPDFILRQ